MALVIFFVPDPARGVAEMVRVVGPGGMLTAYAWDMLGGGFPFDPIQVEMRAVGVTPPLPPSAGVSRIGALHGLWTNAGIQAVETREITVQRTFADFDEFWNSSTITGSIRPTLAAMSAGDEGQCAGSLPRPRRILERTGSHRRSQGGAGGFPSPCPRRNRRVDEAQVPLKRPGDLDRYVTALKRAGLRDN
jgi:hypothetical protein